MTAIDLLDVAMPDCEEAAMVWDRICLALDRYGHVYLFADFDGTVSEFTDVPAKAVIDGEARAALERLSHEKRVSVAVISGRSFSDVMARVGLPIAYAGDHGLEIHAADFDFVVPAGEAVRLRLPAVCNRLRQDIRHIPGAFVEAKRLTASVHYRHVAPELVPSLRLAIYGSVDPAHFEVRDGHYVFEIRPCVEWSKGHAVQWILNRSGAIPEQAICLGDDETDEDMFRRLPEAVNVRVLHGANVHTSAHYCVRRPQVACFLNGIVDAVQGMG